MKYLLLITSLIMELFALSKWVTCWHFEKMFYFTPAILIARVIGGINNDVGMPALMTHALHNKATYFIWGFPQTILQYWDIRFLKSFIGIIGGMGVYLGLWYFLTRDYRKKSIWVLFLLCLVPVCVEIFLELNIIYKWKILLLGIPYIAFSLYGLSQFLKVQSIKRYILVLIVLAFSLGSILLFKDAIYALCLKI